MTHHIIVLYWIAATVVVVLIVRSTLIIDHQRNPSASSPKRVPEIDVVDVNADFLGDSEYDLDISAV